MTTTASLAEIARRDLANFSDRIIGPGDPDYDEVRAVHNGMIDRHPALIVRCATADDVAACVAFGRAHEIPIAVRGDRPGRYRVRWILDDLHGHEQQRNVLVCSHQRERHRRLARRDYADSLFQQHAPRWDAAA